MVKFLEGDSPSPSYSAVVANIDSDSVGYASRTTLQLPRQEMIEDLCTVAKDLLVSCVNNRSTVEKVSILPKRLIFFGSRILSGCWPSLVDGVSEGEVKCVFDLGFPMLQAACIDTELNPPPKITFIIVGKRHHMRFFPKNDNDKDKSGNLHAGTDR